MNKVKQKIEWKTTAGSNVVLSAKWGRISYNPDTTDGHMGSLITALGNVLGANLSDGEETALYNKKDDKFRILTGDFRKEYEKVFPNWNKCLSVYNKNKKKFRNNYSTD